MEDFKWRGKDEEDHHSRNLRRNMEVGRIRFREDARMGRTLVRRRVIGERDREALFATFAGVVRGG